MQEIAHSLCPWTCPCLWRIFGCSTWQASTMEVMAGLEKCSDNCAWGAGDNRGKDWCRWGRVAAQPRTSTGIGIAHLGYIFQIPMGYLRGSSDDAAALSRCDRCPRRHPCLGCLTSYPTHVRTTKHRATGMRAARSLECRWTARRRTMKSSGLRTFSRFCSLQVVPCLATWTFGA